MREHRFEGQMDPDDFDPVVFWRWAAYALLGVLVILGISHLTGASLDDLEPVHPEVSTPVYNHPPEVTNP